MGFYFIGEEDFCYSVQLNHVIAHAWLLDLIESLFLVKYGLSAGKFTSRSNFAQSLNGGTERYPSEASGALFKVPHSLRSGTVSRRTPVHWSNGYEVARSLTFS